MLLLDICEYLHANLDVGEEITAGTLEEDKEKCLGIYENPNLGAENRLKIGGLSCTKHFEKAVSIRVHWSKNTTESEKKAQEIYSFFLGKTDVQIGAYHVAYFDVHTPQLLGFTENGICEYVVPLKIIYGKDE